MKMRTPRLVQLEETTRTPEILSRWFVHKICFIAIHSLQLATVEKQLFRLKLSFEFYFSFALVIVVLVLSSLLSVLVRRFINVVLSGKQE